MDNISLIEFSCSFTKNQFARFVHSLSHGKYDFLCLDLIDVLPVGDSFYVSGYISFDFKMEDLINGSSVESN